MKISTLALLVLAVASTSACKKKEAVPEPSRYQRLCEIVPAEPQQRTASRAKFKSYRDQGLSPESHTIA